MFMVKPMSTFRIQEFHLMQWCPAKAVTKILPFNPTGKPILNVLAGSKTFAFNWGLVTQRK